METARLVTVRGRVLPFKAGDRRNAASNCRSVGSPETSGRFAHSFLVFVDQVVDLAGATIEDRLDGFAGH